MLMKHDHVPVPARRVLEPVVAVHAFVGLQARATRVCARAPSERMKRGVVEFDLLCIDVGFQIALLGELFATELASARPARWNISGLISMFRGVA